jgi:Zn-dependent peptidase ImmA (M78 family)
MAQEESITVNPKILKWARETLNLTIDLASEKIKNKQVTKKDILEQWENGSEKPTIKQLEKLADIYKIPVFIFFFDELPPEPKLPIDFRSDKIEISTELRIKIREVLNIRNNYLLVNESLANNLDFYFYNKATLGDDPELLAYKLKKAIMSDSENPKNWKDKKGALIQWKKIIEKQNILILEKDFKDSSLSGLSISESEKQCPLIVLNIKDDVHRKIFTLFHELCHLILNVSGICNTKQEIPLYSKSNPSIESYCNRFAGAFLVSDDDLSSDNIDWLNITNNEFESEIKGKSKNFKVSREVYLRRLLSKSRINYKRYIYFQNKWKKEYDDFIINEKIKQQNSEIRLPRSYYANKYIKERGIKNVILNLELLHNKRITLYELSQNLNIDVKWISYFENIIIRDGLFD